MNAVAKFIELCSHDDELIAEFDRLTGYNLSRRGTGLELAVDDATGRYEESVAAFAEFVLDLYERLPA